VLLSNEVCGTFTTMSSRTLLSDHIHTTHLLEKMPNLWSTERFVQDNWQMDRKLEFNKRFKEVMSEHFPNDRTRYKYQYAFCLVPPDICWHFWAPPTWARA
jgi:hypothetical protein